MVECKYPSGESLFLSFPKTNKKNWIMDLLDNGSIKQWHEFKREYKPLERFHFQWLQLIDCIPER